MRKEQENQNLKRNQITQKILDMDDFPLPQQAFEEESKAIFQNRIQQASRQGTKPEEIEKNRDEWWKESKRRGKLVKLTLVTVQSCRRRESYLTKEDLAQAATREAMMRREDPTKFIKELSQDRGRLNRLREDIVYDKTLLKIAELSKEQDLRHRGGTHTLILPWVPIYHFLMFMNAKVAKSVPGIYIADCSATELFSLVRRLMIMWRTQLSPNSCFYRWKIPKRMFICILTLRRKRI